MTISHAAITELSRAIARTSAPRWPLAGLLESAAAGDSGEAMRTAARAAQRPANPAAAARTLAAALRTMAPGPIVIHTPRCGAPSAACKCAQERPR